MANKPVPNVYASCNGPIFILSCQHFFLFSPLVSRPEYIGLWLGMAKVGVVPALINSNLGGQPLIHSINAASATAVVYGAELASSEERSTI